MSAKKKIKTEEKKRLAKSGSNNSWQARKKKIVAKRSATKKNSLETTEEKKLRGTRVVNLLRGMKDITPKDEIYWRTLHHKAEDLTNAYGFGYLETPVLEEAALFSRSIGRDTDVVDKEMYVFEDRDGTKVALRPEWTAGSVRAYISHGMQSLPQPIKVWNYGPVFRHDRPQAGRFRQFHQFGCETIGYRHPSLDAELILVAYNFLKDLGISVNVHINSIGNVSDRENYTIELVGYLRSKRSYLCENCKKRITKNPLRVLDCKEEHCAEVVSEAPQIIDWLSEDSKNYFTKVLECLDELSIPYILKSTLVRGLDYYCDTVFEFYEDSDVERAQNALGGGGRYDYLIEQLGGQPTPASGFALGLERVISILKGLDDNNKKLLQKDWSRIFFAQLGEQANYRTLGLIEELRLQNIVVRHNLAKSSLKVQMEIADKLGATHTLILGQKEVHDGTVIIRDMDSGNQEIIDQNKLIFEVKRLLKQTTKTRK